MECYERALVLAIAIGATRHEATARAGLVRLRTEPPVMKNAKEGGA